MTPQVNEHAAQQRNPEAYETHYRQEAVDGIAFIFGTTDGESEVISVRADRNKWTPQSFKIWLERNGYACEVVAATDNPNAINTEPAPEPAPEPVGVTLPEFILQAIALGVKLYEQGNGGGELHPRAVKEARKALDSGEWSAGKIKRADAFLSRKDVDLEPGPLAARLCWGDDPREEQRGADWIKEVAAELSGAPDVNTARHDSPMFYHEANQSQIDDFLIFERKAVEGWPEGVIGLYAVNDDNNEQDLVSILGHSSAWTVETFSRWLEDQGFRASVEPAECEVTSSREAEPVEEPAADAVGGFIEMSAGAQAEAPLHVMRPGPLFDIEGGAQVFDLSPGDLRHIAETTQALIDAGHVVPISFEHGIERGERPGSDRRPYGMATRVFFDEATGGIYAEKSWTKVGLKLVTDSLMADGTTALRVSPRLQMTEAHHPTTGEQLGQAYIDTVSITTTPRQDSMAAVIMSRDTTDQTEEPAPVPAVNETPGPDAGLDTEDHDMSDEKSTLLARGSDEASALFSACGLNEDDGIELLIEKIGNLTVSLDAAGVELARYKKEEDDRAAALLEQETDIELSRFEFATDGERTFFRAALLSGDENQINLAREALDSRTTPNPDELITTAIASAKERGAVAADFILSDEMMETARTSPAIVTALLEAIPTGNIVDTTATAPGSDAAGVEVVADVNREEAANELSRIAHTARREGRATTFTEAYELARAERPELALAVYGD